MNCNKCGTPILPGEHSCRFCGAVGDYSIRKVNVPEPEIIDFNIDINEVAEIVDFAISEDEVSMTPEPKEENMMEEIIDVPVQIPSQNEEANISEIIDEKVEEVISEPVLEEVEKQVELTSSIPVVNSVIEEPPTARIPVEEVKKELEEQKQEEVIEEVIEEKVEEPVVVEEKIVEEKEAEPKKKKNGSKITTIVLTMLLIASIILNCFLLMKLSAPMAKVSPDEQLSNESLTTVFQNRELVFPSNWVINTSNNDYLLVYDFSKEWAASLKFTDTLDYNLVSENVENITNAFGLSQYLFTSDYKKTVNNQEFHIFKGKYYEYAVYIILAEMDDGSLVIVDVKFTGEVIEDVVDYILSTLSTPRDNKINNFTKENFSFYDVTGFLSSIVKETN